MQVNDIALHSDGQTAASVSDDRKVRLWDVCSGRCIGKTQHKPAVNYKSVAFVGRSEGVVATGISHGDQCFLWDAEAIKQSRFCVCACGVVRVIVNAATHTDTDTDIHRHRHAHTHTR